MKSIKVPALHEVSMESQELFEQLKRRLGKVPNLYATIGHSSNALKGFLDFEASFNKGSFTPKEREAIALTVSEVNGCEYCLAAHTMIAMKQGISQSEIIDIRKGSVEDSKLNALLMLAKSIVQTKSHPAPEILEAFFNVGFNEEALMELIGLITVRIFTNYVYSLTNIPLDFPAALPLNYTTI